MNNFVIGTAGHIDHGKSSLIKALTGVDTDTLKEEKKRGITIDLGFTYLKLDKLTAGIVDVPGHEKLIKNMLSGVCGINMILLVVACDDGIMPQTREHYDIIKYLQIDNTLTVLTKTDLVDSDRVESVKKQVTEEFGLSEFVEFSIYKDAEHIKNKINDMIPLDVDEEELNYYRMPIDRVFSVKGYGVVVTGSSISGKVEVGDKLEILPTKKQVRVKNIQVFNKSVDIAYKRTRVALNLAGVTVEDLKRGKILATPNVLNSTKIIDVEINLTEGEEIRHLEVVRFNYLANEIKARVKLFNKKVIRGKEYAQLLLDTELYAVNGDLGVLRRINPNITIAGVVIHNVLGKFASRKDLSYTKEIEAFASKDISSLLKAYAKRNILFTEREVSKELGVVNLDILIKLGDYYILEDMYTELKRRVISIVDEYHKENSNDLGINKQMLLSKLDLDEKKANALLRSIDSLNVSNIVSRKDFSINLSDEEELIASRISNHLESNGFKPPKIKTLDEVLNGKSDIYHTLLKLERLIKLDDEITITSSMLDSMIEVFDDYFANSQVLGIGEARELLDSSRRYVVAYLEYLDKIGYTHRVEGGRKKKG